MDLLLDPWVPILAAGRIRHASLKEVLCSNAHLHLRMRRDDMELAALQLAVCLTQVLLPPADAKELRDRAAKPVQEKQYDKAITAYEGWFDLRHEKQPFMQSRGVKAKEITPIQKLFVGLPAGEGSHQFFNTERDIEAVCAPCAAVALFNQAGDCPSFGGGFKDPLRGGSAVTTLAMGAGLRETIWLNVLQRQTIEKLHPGDWGRPVWVEPVRRGELVNLSNIGFMRGLFWQPAHVELSWEQADLACNACGMKAGSTTKGLRKEKFKYNLGNDSAQWRHPHSPRQRRKVKEKGRGERMREFFVSFRETAPAWTQLTDFLLGQPNEEGGVLAPVVAQYREVFRGRRLDLAVGGYRNRRAKILDRRHELFSLSRGWEDAMEGVRTSVGRALEIKDALRRRAYGFGKSVGAPGLASEAESRFYSQSEDRIHSVLQIADWKQIAEARRKLVGDLCRLAEGLFEELAEPYRRQPRALEPYLLARRRLRQDLNEVRRRG